MNGALAKSTVKTSVILALRVVTQAISLIFLTHLLSAESYGKLASSSSLAVTLGILPSLGAGYVMMTLASQRADAVTLVWRYAWPLTLSAGLLLLGVYVLITRAIAGANALPPESLLYIGISELIIMPFITLLSFSLQARDQVPLSQIVQWLPLSLRVLAILPCFSISASERLNSYLMFQLFASIVGLLFSAIISRNYITLDWRPQLISSPQLKNGVSYSTMHLVAANSGEIDKILAMRFASAQDVGIYSAANRVATSIVMPVTALLLSAQPRIFRETHQASSASFHLIKILIALAAVWGAISWIFLSLLSPLLPRLFGPEFLNIASIMPLLAAASLPLSVRQTTGAILVALGKPMSRVFFELTGMAALLCSLMLFTPYGVNGLAIALIISELTMALLSCLFIYKYLRETN